MFTAARGGFNYYGFATDPYWTSVTFLENFEYPLPSFVDSSTNNFSLTINGTVVPSAQTPFTAGTGGSQYYNGSSYVAIPDSNQFYLTGDFTMEAWVYLTVNSTRRTIVTHWPGGVAANCAFAWEIFNNNKIYFSYGIGALNSFYASTSTLTTNTWYHLAVSRSGTTFRCFINGTVESNTLTMSGALNNGTGNVQMGSMPTEGNFMSGYISNLRILNGTCLYTSSFTPPTSPLTNITNTALLVNATNQGLTNNATFVNSANSQSAITVNGSPRYSGLSPLTNTYPGSYSMGSGNYLSAAGDAGYNLSNGNYTIEAWIYCTTFSLQGGLNVLFSWGTGSYATVRISTTSVIIEGAPSASKTVTFPVTLSTNTWYHFALVRSSSTTLTAYINGTAGTPNTTLTSSNTYGDSSSALNIGYKGDPQYFYGNIYNLRITKTDLYSSNFTPSTTPLSLTTNTTFLGLAYGAFQDLSNSGQLITSTTSAIVNTQQYKFGSQASYYTATNYQTVSDNSGLQFGTGDFTIEGWVYLTSASVLQGIIAKGAAATGWILYVSSSNYLVWASASTALKTSTSTISSNTWVYLAITRSGTTGYMFINGTLDGTGFTDSSNYNQTNNMVIGCDRSNLNGFNGYMDDIRITKGVCRYTATFTAPTSTFPTM